MSVTPTDILRESVLDVRPMSGHCGAEIFGADLSAPLGDDTVA